MRRVLADAGTARDVAQRLASKDAVENAPVFFWNAVLGKDLTDERNDFWIGKVLSVERGAGFVLRGRTRNAVGEVDFAQTFGS